jgi:hypothetical protein
MAAVAAQHPVAQHASQHSAGHNDMWPLEVLLVLIGVFIGRIWGKRAGLRHLGEAEFRTRLTAARRVRRW